jgi:hypothetical protein
MAYVVARRNGRFEIRESLHTPSGPRARTLAGFGVLSEEVLARAGARARRPFDPAAVLASGRRAGAEVTARAQMARAQSTTPERGAARRASEGRFLAASGRMARSVRRAARAERMTPGDALIDLLGFADAVTASQPARPTRALAFPALARLLAERRAAAGLASG